MFHTVVRDEQNGSRTINFLSLSESLFLHRQIEQRDGKTFMRAKRRSVPDVAFQT